jgi:hypothetical protein
MDMTDLLLQKTNGQLAVWYWDGAKVASGDYVAPTMAIPSCRAVGVADINGDGWLDVAFQDSSERVGFWFLRGTALLQGQFSDPEKAAEAGYRLAGLGDLDSDGHPDLVFQNDRNGAVVGWLMDGTRLKRGVLISTLPAASRTWQIKSVGSW